MNDEIRSAREERLRTVLRHGDPAGVEPGLAPEEVRRMRRAILSTASGTSKPRRRALWLPATAAAALTLTLALGLWRTPAERLDPVPEPGRQAVALPEPVLPEPVVPAPPVPEEGAAPPIAVPAPEAAPRRVEALRRLWTRPAPPEPVRLASAPEAQLEPPGVQPDSPFPAEESPVRQVQLEAPGGTRVIWTLSTESVIEDLSE